MREIRFRGKGNDGWHFGSFVDDNGSGRVRIYDGRKYHKVDPDTIGQFTGMRDKHGRKVYEGDTVLVGGSVGVIAWDAVHARWGREIPLRCTDQKIRDVAQSIGAQTVMEVVDMNEGGLL